LLHVDWSCRQRIVGANEHGRVLLKIDITDFVVENEIKSESFHQWVIWPMNYSDIFLQRREKGMKNKKKGKEENWSKG
jgi:hypothetical protein